MGPRIREDNGGGGGGMGPRIREDKGGGEVFIPIQTFPRRGGRVGRGEGWVPACGDLCVTTKTHSDSGVGRLLSQPNHGILDSGFRRNDGYAKVSICEDKRGGDGIDGDAADGGRGERMGSRMRVGKGGEEGGSPHARGQGRQKLIKDDQANRVPACAGTGGDRFIAPIVMLPPVVPIPRAVGVTAAHRLGSRKLESGTGRLLLTGRPETAKHHFHCWIP